MPPEGICYAEASYIVFSHTIYWKSFHDILKFHKNFLEWFGGQSEDIKFFGLGYVLPTNIQKRTEISWSI